MKRKIQSITIEEFALILILLLLFVLGGAVTYAQQPGMQNVVDKTISISDKAKYKDLQHDITDALKDQMIAQLEAKQQYDQAVAPANAKVSYIITATEKSLGIPEDDMKNWQFDPSTMTFSRIKQVSLPTASGGAPPKSADKK